MVAAAMADRAAGTEEVDRVRVEESLTFTMPSTDSPHVQEDTAAVAAAATEEAVTAEEDMGSKAVRHLLRDQSYQS